MDFGMIRSLAQAPPSKEAWEELCKTLDRVQEPRDLERALGYLEGALRRWPRELRVVPSIWRKAMMNQGKDVLGVARVGELKQLQTSHVEALERSGALGMRGLERLEFIAYSGGADTLGALLGAQGLEDLSELSIMSMYSHRDYCGKATSTMWEDFSRAVREHEKLERLELRGMKGMRSKDYGVLFEHPLGVDALTVERSGLRSSQIRRIARQVAAGVTELDLGANDLGDEGWLKLASHDLSGLEALRLDRTRGGDEGSKRLAARPMPNLERLALVHVDMTEVGVGAWMGASFERLRELELDLSGSHAALAVALENAAGFDALERVMLRFNSTHDTRLCEAMADLSLLRGVRDVHLFGLDAGGLEVLLRSEALAGVERLMIEHVHMSDGAWEALATADHLSSLTDLTLKRAQDGALTGPGYGAFCAADGLRTLQNLTYDQCDWNGLQRLANSARIGTLTSLTLRNTEFDDVELERLFANEGVERMERFEMFPHRLMTREEASACLRAPRHPSAWSPPYSALKAFSKAEAREARRLWARW